MSRIHRLIIAVLPIFIGILVCLQAQAVPMPPLLGKIIVIDPGHGGIDGGTHDNNGLMEKNLNLEIAHRLTRHLKDFGAFIILTRDGDHELSYMSSKYRSRHRRDLNSRVLIAEKSHADMMLSLHVNSSSGSYVRGSLVFYQPDSEDSKRLAYLIQEEMSTINSWNDNRPLVGRVYYILRNSPSTTVLIETGYLTNPEEKILLCQEEYQEKIAAAITTAVLRYYQE